MDSQTHLNKFLKCWVWTVWKNHDKCHENASLNRLTIKLVKPIVKTPQLYNTFLNSKFICGIFSIMISLCQKFNKNQTSNCKQQCSDPIQYRLCIHLFNEHTFLSVFVLGLSLLGWISVYISRLLTKIMFIIRADIRHTCMQNTETNEAKIN